MEIGAPRKIEGLVVAVLAGGEGRRMGGVKALRSFRGAPLVAQALARARGWSEQVVVAVRDAEQVAGAVDAPLACDRADIPGPLAGLAGALAHARAAGAELLLTLPCDMPHLPADLPERLAGALGPAAGAALPRVEGEVQPVCGLWRTTALERLPAYLASGQSSLRGFAAACGLATVDFGPDEAGLFANANTPEELARLERGD
ncbi:molybdenum cofactor guanylyltransferase [Phenylobacterium sp. LjRoot219]|uniref:molybdenum cofactor guanylyltransferase n=1 Tax=Phenylobacterium sp. LjRoot219 TaxID=3342283 RepID=UPI003ED14FBF